MTEICYREMTKEELNRTLFSSFNRRQVVQKCWRRVNGQWVIRDDPFIDDWSEEDYTVLLSGLQNTVSTGGLVCGAFVNGVLKGFVSVESKLFGGENRYLDLTNLHVSAELRGRGIGSALFDRAEKWAKSKGAKKLYLSAHSAVESQVFYKKMGCVEAKEYSQRHVEAEPFDCQLECAL